MSEKNGQTSRELPRELSPRQVAEAIGVSVSSLKRWCDRGDLPTTKTAGGHRRIPRSAVVRFIRERGYQAKHPDLLGIPAGARLDAREHSEVLPQLVDALVEGDEARLSNVLTGLFLARKSISEISDDYLSPAFADIGRQWECGSVAVYEEHRAIVIVHRVLTGLRSFLSDPEGAAPLVLSTTLCDDPYTLPITLIEMSMRELGWDAMVLGPNNPAESLCEAIRKLSPRMLCVSVSHVRRDQRLVSEVRKLYECCLEEGAALVIGGRAIEDENRSDLQATAFCSGMRDLVALARALEPKRSLRAGA